MVTGVKTYKKKLIASKKNTIILFMDIDTLYMYSVVLKNLDVFFKDMGNPDLVGICTKMMLRARMFPSKITTEFGECMYRGTKMQRVILQTNDGKMYLGRCSIDGVIYTDRKTVIKGRVYEKLPVLKINDSSNDLSGQLGILKSSTDMEFYIHDSRKFFTSLIDNKMDSIEDVEKYIHIYSIGRAKRKLSLPDGLNRAVFTRVPDAIILGGRDTMGTQIDVIERNENISKIVYKEGVCSLSAFDLLYMLDAYPSDIKFPRTMHYVNGAMYIPKSANEFRTGDGIVRLDMEINGNMIKAENNSVKKIVLGKNCSEVGGNFFIFTKGIERIEIHSDICFIAEYTFSDLNELRSVAVKKEATLIIEDSLLRKFMITHNLEYIE